MQEEKRVENKKEDGYSWNLYLLQYTRLNSNLEGRITGIKVRVIQDWS